MRQLVAAFTLAVTCSFLAAPVAAAPKATTVSYTPGLIKIEIFIEVFGDGASIQLAKQWESLIESHWNKQLAKYGCSCLRVEVDAHVRYNHVAGNISEVTEGWEGWEVKPREQWETEDENWLPYVEFPDGLQENSDRFEGESGGGQLATDEPWVVIHEAGHLMGQHDAYDFPSDWVKGDPVNVHSGWEENIMSGPKLDLGLWNTFSDRYFSAKNYETILAAALDYLQEQGQPVPLGAAEFQLSMSFDHNSWGPSGPAVKNTEHAEAYVDLCVRFAKAKMEPSDSVAVMFWRHGDRIPGTWYGGNRTVNNPFPMYATGVLDDSMFRTYLVELEPGDLVQNYLKTGEVYATGGHLFWAFDHSRFDDPHVSGSLKRMEISELMLMMPGTTAKFRIESPAIQNVQTVGEGTLTFERSVLFP